MPLDFKFFASEAEETVARANASESHEKQREFFGLTGLRLLQLIEDVKRIIAATPSADGKMVKPNSTNVAQYLKDHIEWATPKRVPSAETVNQLMSIGAMLRKSSLAKQIIQMSESMFGRDNFFEQCSKLLIIVQRASSVPEFETVMSGIFATMARTNEADPFSKGEVSGKAGPVNFWLFIKKLNKYLLSQYQAHSANPEQEKLVQRAVSILESPLEWLRNFPPKDNIDQTWAGGLPPLLGAVLEFGKLAMGGAFNQALKGMLANPPSGPGGLTPLAFLESEAMKSEKCKLDDLLKKQNGVPEEISAGRGVGEKAHGSADDGEKPDNKSQLESDASDRAGEQVNRSVVFLVPNPTSTSVPW